MLVIKVMWFFLSESKEKCVWTGGKRRFQCLTVLDYLRLTGVRISLGTLELHVERINSFHMI